MNPFRLTVTLKQHTPLLHFQHNQAGAILRASEVKPKLDKFIRERRESDFPVKWRIGKEKGEHKNALDYSLWVSASETPQVLVIKTFFNRTDQNVILYSQRRVGSYFGDAKGLEWRDGLTITFSSFETDVLDQIYQHVVPFFILHNFGQRQSKGFGSFTVSAINEKCLDGYGGKSFAKSDFESILQQSFATVYRPNDQTYRPLELIHKEYQLLKSGRNNPWNSNEYRKSALFLYFVNQNPPIRWEKRKIKQEINGVTNKQEKPFAAALKQTSKLPIDLSKRTCEIYNSYTDEQPNEYRYIRALLGLAEANEYQTEGGDSTYLVRIKHEPINGSDEDQIERLASPILFKVFENSAYLIAGEVNENIFRKSFQFSLSTQSINARNLTTLKTPDSFDLPGFLKESLTTWTKLP